AFTDKVGSKHHHDKLTQARAETMLTYLWANGFRSTSLSAEGYGHYYPVANNKLIHGAAQNRRMEIQRLSWLCPLKGYCRVLFCRAYGKKNHTQLAFLYSSIDTIHSVFL